MLSITSNHDISIWMKTNKLKLNDDKSEVLMFGMPKQLEKLNISELKIENTMFTASSKARNLGVIMDKHLSMGPYASSVCKSGHYHLRNLSQVRKYLDPSSCEKAVHAFVTSRLDFCNSLLAGVKKNSLLKLQRVQNAAAKVVTKKKKYDHVTPLLQKLHWLPIEKRIIFKILIITYKCLNGVGPFYITSDLLTIQPVRNTRSANTILLHQPRTKLKFAGDRAFSSIAPKLWNSLPSKIRESTSLASFKSKLKTHLFPSLD